MNVFHQLGMYITELMNSFILFFRFIGHLFHSIIKICIGRLSISLDGTVKTIYYSGTKLVIPLIIISILMGISLVLNIHNILVRFNLQHQARIIAQNILTHDLVPLLIGVLLCIQSALNFITVGVDKPHKMPQEVVISHVLPIIIGINIAGALLYTYCITAFFLSIYITFIYILQISAHEYFLHITGYMTLVDFGYSILKTLLYCTIVSLTIGYYYYVVAVKNDSLRQAVSRIMTRGLLWLTLCSACLNLINF